MAARDNHPRATMSKFTYRPTEAGQKLQIVNTIPQFRFDPAPPARDYENFPGQYAAKLSGQGHSADSKAKYLHSVYLSDFTFLHSACYFFA
jgi:hypothetical protein